MISFIETKTGYEFYSGKQIVAEGSYEEGQFILVEQQDMKFFSNAMQAFCHLRSTHNVHTEPLKQATIDLFTPGKRSNPSIRARQCAV